MCLWAHLTSFEFCPVFDKNRAKVRLCVCSGVLVMVIYGHDRFFVTVTSRMDIIHDVTKSTVHLCDEKICDFNRFLLHSSVAKLNNRYHKILSELVPMNEKSLLPFQL